MCVTSVDWEICMGQSATCAIEWVTVAVLALLKAKYTGARRGKRPEITINSLIHKYNSPPTKDYTVFYEWVSQTDRHTMTNCGRVQ